MGENSSFRPIQKKRAVLTGERWNFCTLNAENVQQF
jgi:hypothetical protein